MKQIWMILGFVSTLALAQQPPRPVTWQMSTAPCTPEGCVIERSESQPFQINVYLKEFNDTFGRISVLLEQDADDHLLYPSLIASRYGDVPEIENCPSQGEFCTSALIARIDTSRGFSLAHLLDSPLGLGILSHDSDDLGFWINLSAIDQGTDVLVTVTVEALEKQDGEWIRTDILGTKSRSMTFTR